MADEKEGLAAPEDEDDDAILTAIDPRAWDRLREAMATGTGLTRDAQSLRRARAQAEEIGRSGAQGLKRAALAASLICRAAIEREESRGVHYRTDYPDTLSEWDDRHVAYRSE
jgi:L-aspartate oxidase